MFTNTKNIPLPLAVMLARDTYDYNPDPQVFSASQLLKSTKSLILGENITDVVSDIASYVPSRMGTALHEAMEAAWVDPIPSLLKLGYNMETAIGINASISFEKRSQKAIGDFTITGMYDVVFDGMVQDLKSCSSWKWVFNDTDDFVKQMSIYKWLNPDEITEPYGKIMYWFTDWSAKEAKKSGYPQFRIQEKILLLDENIEQFIVGKLADITKARSTGEVANCTDKELWRKPNTWAFFSNPKSLGRATKVFDNPGDAHDWQADKGKGTVIHRPGKVVACNYCNAVDICSQAAGYIKSGELTREVI